MRTMVSTAIAGPEDSAQNLALDAYGSNHKETGGHVAMSDCMCAVQRAASAGAMPRWELRAVSRIEGIAAPFQTKAGVMCWKRLSCGYLGCPEVPAHGSSQHQ